MQSIDSLLLIATVGVGVGLFLVVAILRILFKIKLSYLLIGFYAIVFVVAFLLPNKDYLAVAFDSGGVTTGPMTVPFIMALGVGIASVRSDRNSDSDSFGLVALSSIGPILSLIHIFVKIKGLITREIRYKDNDKLLTVVTAERGRLTVRARGVMRLRSPLASACQLYAYSDFTLFENKGRLTVNAAEPAELFMGLRTDAQKLALAAYIADIAEKISDSDAENGELLRLTLNSLYALSERAEPLELVRAAFEMRAAKVAGYEPQLDACLRCGNPPEAPYISPALGGVCCRNCLTAEENTCLLYTSRCV